MVHLPNLVRRRCFSSATVWQFSLLLLGNHCDSPYAARTVTSSGSHLSSNKTYEASPVLQPELPELDTELTDQPSEPELDDYDYDHSTSSTETSMLQSSGGSQNSEKSSDESAVWPFSSGPTESERLLDILIDVVEERCNADTRKDKVTHGSCRDEAKGIKEGRMGIWTRRLLRRPTKEGKPLSLMLWNGLRSSERQQALSGLKAEGYYTDEDVGMSKILEATAKKAGITLSALCKTLPGSFWETNSVALVEEAFRGQSDGATLKIILGRAELASLEKTIFSKFEWPALARIARRPINFELIFPASDHLRTDSDAMTVALSLREIFRRYTLEEQLQHTWKYGYACDRASLGSCKLEALPGDENIKAINNKGVMFEKGWLVGQNYQLAAQYFTQCMEKGNVVSTKNMGYMYENGVGVEKSLEKAVVLYKQAADKGHAGAQASLGYMYEHGRGVEKNLEKAVVLYKQAADKGHAGAQSHLGSMYYNGKGVNRDYDMACELFDKASKSGDVLGTGNLGLCYEHGRGGFEKNMSKAKELYKQAAAAGSSWAENSLKQLSR